MSYFISTAGFDSALISESIRDKFGKTPAGRKVGVNTIRHNVLVATY
jgi:hypothetical protein